MRLLLIALLCGVSFAAEKGVLPDDGQSMTGYCTGAAESSESGQDAPRWAGFCQITDTEGGFRINADLAGPIRENFYGRTATLLVLRDQRERTPLIFIKFDDWLSVTFLPSSPYVRDEIVRAVAKVGDDREPLVIHMDALVYGRPHSADGPDNHVIVIDVVGIDWPLE